MDPETPSAIKPAETPSTTEPVVRPRPPRERHLPAHLTDYEVQLPPNLHLEPPPADSALQRPSRPSRHASRSISSGTVSSTSSRSHSSVQRRSSRHGLSDLQAAMLEERLKTLDLEELQQRIEVDAIVDKECERFDAQAREAQYRQEQATKARELLAKQVESRRRLKKVQNELEVAKYVRVLLKQECSHKVIGFASYCTAHFNV
ncbi:circadian locomoter output cycles kaput-like protein [Labeo rohita]|uniref:Circadian locomoter output cycles kaput-like protein n=1 Tax=Labeo rohita TaxID=84645 RepID=A0A498N5W7_LABRO|nr:circadian locomoter output cycles kaput-like protein [Labeo rohita]